jgi:manganese-dependent ADP-ribose/CDP-alcohol diphosphatase
MASISASKNVSKRILSAGILADVQYADSPDALDYHKKNLRKYRQAGESLKEACQHYQKSPCSPSFYLQLGDLIDGRCRKPDICDSSKEKCMEDMLSHFENAGISENSIVHCSGNHEFYNFNREELTKYLYNGKQLFEDTLAFVQEVTDKLVIMHVDTYDIADGSREETNPKTKIAKDILKKWHTDDNYNNVDEKLMKGLDCRFVGYTGMVGESQLKWIDQKLTEFDEAGKMVIMCSHTQMHPLASDHVPKVNLTWNWEEVLSVIHSHKCVILYAAGHAHSGGYVKDDKGVHHLVPKAILENSGSVYDGSGNTFGYLHFYEEFMELEVLGVSSDSWSSRKMEYPFGLKLE